MSEEPEITRGPDQDVLATAVSSLIAGAITLTDMETDQAVCIALTVCADYARVYYGNEYLKKLAELIIRRGDDPLPEIERIPTW